MNNKIISPCISICKTDPKTGFCYGCSRSNEETKSWKLEQTSDQWKKDNIATIKKRLTGWQLESFEESYTYKIKNGISLFKKNLKILNWANFTVFFLNFNILEIKFKLRLYFLKLKYTMKVCQVVIFYFLVLSL